MLFNKRKNPRFPYARGAGAIWRPRGCFQRAFQALRHGCIVANPQTLLAAHVTPGNPDFNLHLFFKNSFAEILLSQLSLSPTLRVPRAVRGIKSFGARASRSPPNHPVLLRALSGPARGGKGRSQSPPRSPVLFGAGALRPVTPGAKNSNKVRRRNSLPPPDTLFPRRAEGASSRTAARI